MDRFTSGTGRADEAVHTIDQTNHRLSIVSIDVFSSGNSGGMWTDWVGCGFHYPCGSWDFTGSQDHHVDRHSLSPRCTWTPTVVLSRCMSSMLMEGDLVTDWYWPIHDYAIQVSQRVSSHEIERLAFGCVCGTIKREHGLVECAV